MITFYQIMFRCLVERLHGVRLQCCGRPFTFIFISYNIPSLRVRFVIGKYIYIYILKPRARSSGFSFIVGSETSFYFYQRYKLWYRCSIVEIFLVGLWHLVFLSLYKWYEGCNLVSVWEDFQNFHKTSLNIPKKILDLKNVSLPPFSLHHSLKFVKSVLVWRKKIMYSCVFEKKSSLEFFQQFAAPWGEGVVVEKLIKKTLNRCSFESKIFRIFFQIWAVFKNWKNTQKSLLIR